MCKIVLLYLNANNCVDQAPATDLVEHRLGDSCRAMVGDAEVLLRGVHALRLGIRALRIGKARDTRLDPGARSREETSSLICLFPQT